MGRSEGGALMNSKDYTAIIIAAFLLLMLVLTPKSYAEPTPAIEDGLLRGSELHSEPTTCTYRDVRMCDMSKAYYCPSTGTMGPWYAVCPEYVTGPRMPGMG